MSNDKQSVIYEFGDFRIDAGQRVLTRNCEPVALPPKAFEMLLYLVQNGGQVLEKEAFMNALWPDSFVEESNLTQHIFLLRKILGNQYIQTIPRRGYKFVVHVKQTENGLGAGMAEYWSRHSPFRSLRAFEPEDSWLFFG